MTWALQQSYDVAGGVLVLHLLAIPTAFLARSLLRQEPDRLIRRMIIAALAVKLIGTLVRYAVVFGVYGGKADASEYHRIGTLLAEAFRQGDFTVDLGHRAVGTGFIEIVTGVVYALVGPTKLGGFLVFSWFGFWGLCLFYRAFSLAFPGGNRRRYAGFVFFLPSMAFWPSSIGKEAWMTLMLGATAYGVVRLLSRGGSALPWLLVGLIGTGVVRPHITITIVASLGVAYLLSSPRRTGFAAPFAKMAGMVTLLLVFVVVLSSVQSQFKLEKGQGVEDVLDRTQLQTTQDGSEFQSVAARSPVDIPLATFSVLFRPLPFEARNVQALLASLEGGVLLVLFIKHWRHLRNLFPRRRAPYLTFVSMYTLLFVIAFSNFGNFGILARQRVQLFPFALVALAVPPLLSKASTSPSVPLRQARPQTGGRRRSQREPTASLR